MNAIETSRQKVNENVVGFFPEFGLASFGEKGGLGDIIIIIFFSHIRQRIMKERGSNYFWSLASWGSRNR